MKKLGRFLALLLSATLALSIVLWTLGNTLGNAAYLMHAADQSELYNRLAPVIPGSDSDLIRSRFETIVPALINYLLLGGPVPTADFGEGPVTLIANDAPGVGFVQALPPVAMGAPVASIVFFVLILVIVRRHRLSTLRRAAFATTLSLLLSAALFWFGPNIVMKVLTQPDLQPLLAALSPFLNQVFHDIGLRIAVAGFIMAGIAGGIMVLHSAITIQNRFRGPAVPKSEGNATPFPPR